MAIAQRLDKILSLNVSLSLQVTRTPQMRMLPHTIVRHIDTFQGVRPVFYDTIKCSIWKLYTWRHQHNLQLPFGDLYNSQLDFVGGSRHSGPEIACSHFLLFFVYFW